MKYITITSTNGRNFYLARQRIGGGYNTLATFKNEIEAKHICEVMNYTDIFIDEYEELKKKHDARKNKPVKQKVALV